MLRKANLHYSEGSMETTTVLVPNLVLTLAIMLLTAYNVWKSGKALIAAHAWCDADVIFVEWRCRNPGVYIGLSDEGKRLLGILIAAYDEFLRWHSFIGDNGTRDRLLSLYNDLPPKSPNDADNSEGPAKQAGSFYINWRTLPHTTPQMKQSS